MARLGHHKTLLDQLVGFVMKAHGAVAAVVGLVGFAAAALRWARRRHRPAAVESVEPVKFSGRTRKAFIDRVELEATGEITLADPGRLTARSAFTQLAPAVALAGSQAVTIVLPQRFPPLIGRQFPRHGWGSHLSHENWG